MVPYYVGMVVPFILIYIFYWILFAIIIISLTRKTCVKKDAKQQKKDGNISFVRQQLIIVITLSILFGLGWGIGLLATQDLHSSPEVRDLFAALFVIVTAFHGLFIFVMHCLRSTDVRREWNRWFHGATGKDFTEFTSTSGARRPFRAGQTSSTSGTLPRSDNKKSRQFSADLSSPRQSDVFTYDSDTLKHSTKKGSADVELAVFSEEDEITGEAEKRKEKEREIEEMERENAMNLQSLEEVEESEVEKEARKILEEQSEEQIADNP